ncbi:MAG: polysaccharide pyruvyl transferase family protein, partial [Caulobacter sp.]
DGDELNYFLDFGKPGLRRLSYAASFGHSQWAYPARAEAVKAALARMDHVSVREASGKTICAQELGRDDAVHVLDPTLVVERALYDRIAPGEESGEGVVTYVLDHAERVRSIAQAASEAIGRPGKIKAISTRDENMDVAGWIRSFRAADFVVTDSFHGMVFAIVFGKPFIVVPNDGRGLDRFVSLLGLLGLTHRLAGPQDDGETLKAIINAPVDYSAVNARLAELREASKDYLRAALAPEGGRA